MRRGYSATMHGKPSLSTGAVPLTVEPRRCVVTVRLEKDAPGTPPPRP